jgi:hypothetical protein
MQVVLITYVPLFHVWLTLATDSKLLSCQSGVYRTHHNNLSSNKRDLIRNYNLNKAIWTIIKQHIHSKMQALLLSADNNRVVLTSIMRPEVVSIWKTLKRLAMPTKKTIFMMKFKKSSLMLNQIIISEMQAQDREEKQPVRNQCVLKWVSNSIPKN